MRNTFGEYKFDDWVPEHEKKLIRAFWGWRGRTHQDWLNAPTCYAEEFPRIGDVVKFTRVDLELVKNEVTGRFLYMWNNIGRVIDKEGESHLVSSSDNWEHVNIGVNNDRKK